MEITEGAATDADEDAVVDGALVEHDVERMEDEVEDELDVLVYTLILEL